MKTIDIPMTWKKETKNTHVYEADEDAAVTTVYVQKSAFDGEAPESIQLTIKEI
jgi:hypothetical protein